MIKFIIGLIAVVFLALAAYMFTQSSKTAEHKVAQKVEINTQKVVEKKTIEVSKHVNTPSTRSFDKPTQKSSNHVIKKKDMDMMNLLKIEAVDTNANVSPDKLERLELERKLYNFNQTHDYSEVHEITEEEQLELLKANLKVYSKQ